MKIPTYNRLTNQTAVVTGANSGIGKAVAQQLAREGARVVINYVTGDEAAASLVDDIKKEGGEATAIRADVSNEQEVQEMFQKTCDTYQSVHILVNNAGIQKDASFADMKLEDWQKVLDVNLNGQFLCAREAIREFLKRDIDEHVSVSRGKIICMSSVHEIIPWAGHANYAASKGGIMLMMKSIAQEYAGQDIRINSIAPGAIKTPINKMAWEKPEELEKLLRLIPANRLGKPEDIARAAVWLASDESGYVNGTTLVVDGGMTLYPGFATGG